MSTLETENFDMILPYVWSRVLPFIKYPVPVHFFIAAVHVRTRSPVPSFLEMILWFWTVVCHSMVLSTQITSNHLHQSYNDTQPTLFCDSISQSVSDHEFNLSCTDCPELQLQRKNVRSTKSHYVQHWLRKWFGSVRQHAIFLSNDNSNLCCHMTQ